MDIESPKIANSSIYNTNELKTSWEIKKDFFSSGKKYSNHLNILHDIDSKSRLSRFPGLQANLTNTLEILSKMKSRKGNFQNFNDENQLLRNAYEILIQASDISEVFSKSMNLNYKLKSHEICSYGKKISTSCQAPSGFNLQSNSFISHPPHPDEIEISRSYLQYVYGSYFDRCQKPKIDIINNLLVQDNLIEMKLFSNTNIELKLNSLDSSFINYTLDNSAPTAHLGICYTNQNETEPMVITITKSCTLKAICHKSGHLESEILERKILIDINNNALFDEAERPKFFINNENFSVDGTPYTPHNYLTTPFYTPFNMNSKFEDDTEEENFLY